MIQIVSSESFLFEYSISAPTAKARLEGSVQGVVVHASKRTFSDSFSLASRSKATVTAGSCLGRVASSSLISKFESGVSAPHEYGITRNAS